MLFAPRSNFLKEFLMISDKPRALAILFGCVCLLLVLERSDFAQIPAGALVGTVSDTNGARIAGATVSAQAVGSSLKREAVTKSSGEYRVEGLPPSDYRVTVSAPNFSPIVYVVRLTVNSSPTVPVILKPGAVSATVQVQEIGR